MRIEENKLVSVHAASAADVEPQYDTKAAIPYTELLAGFCSRLEYADIPADVVARTKLCILDSVGTMLAGATTELGASVYRAATGFETSAISTVFGFRTRSSPTAAALVKAEAYWARLCAERWNKASLNLAQHGNSWKRLASSSGAGNPPWPCATAFSATTRASAPVLPPGPAAPTRCSFTRPRPTTSPAWPSRTT